MLVFVGLLEQDGLDLVTAKIKIEDVIVSRIESMTDKTELITCPVDGCNMRLNRCPARPGEEFCSCGFSREVVA